MSIVPPDREPAPSLRLYLDVNETLIRTGERTAAERRQETEELSRFVELVRSLAAARPPLELVLVTGNSFEYCRRIEEPLGLKNLPDVSLVIVSENGLIARCFRRGDLWRLRPPPRYFTQSERFLESLAAAPELGGRFYTQGNEIRITVKPVADAFDERQLGELERTAERVFEPGVSRRFAHRYYFDVDPAAVLVRGEETPFAGKALAVDRLSRDGAPALAVGDSESDLDMFEAVARTGGRSFWVANVADPGAFPAAGILAEPYAAGVNRLLESVLAGPATPFEGRPETPAAEQRTPSGNLPGETR